MLKPNRLAQLEAQVPGVLLAMLGYGEARGEGSQGILAVMHVATNRAAKGITTLKDVILAPYQFSCFNHNDPNRDLLLMADKDTPQTWGQCAAIAELVLTPNATNDPTHGATHYYASSIPPPAWTQGWTQTAIIGHHTFGIAV